MQRKGQSHVDIFRQLTKNGMKMETIHNISVKTWYIISRREERDPPQIR